MIPFLRKKDELSLEDGCTLCGPRVVIPLPGRCPLIEELHEAYSEITRMKSLARGYIWWPGMDGDLETMVKHCQVCQLHRHNPPLAPVHPCHWPNRPWSRVHVDYAGPFMFLLIIDSHSKWLDIHGLVERAVQTFKNEMKKLSGHLET